MDIVWWERRGKRNGMDNGITALGWVCCWHYYHSRTTKCYLNHLMHSWRERFPGAISFNATLVTAPYAFPIPWMLCGSWRQLQQPMFERLNSLFDQKLRELLSCSMPYQNLSARLLYFFSILMFGDPFLASLHFCYFFAILLNREYNDNCDARTCTLRR